MFLVNEDNFAGLFNLFNTLLRAGEAAYDLYSFLLFFDVFLIWELSMEG
jgi:hypothetical protein